MRRAAALLMLALVSPILGCDIAIHDLVVGQAPPIQGSGKAVTVERAVAPFTEVAVGGVIHAEVAVGPGPRVAIHGDDNIVPLVVAEVDGGRLSVNLKANASIRPKLPLTVRLTTEALTAAEALGASEVRVSALQAGRIELTASGASTVVAGGLDVGELAAEADGASTITLAGRAGSASIEASGASRIRAGELNAESATLRLLGASSGTIRASAAVEGAVSGASNLEVLGQPRRKAVTTSGASTISYAPAG